MASTATTVPAAPGTATNKNYVYIISVLGLLFLCLVLLLAKWHIDTVSQAGVPVKRRCSAVLCNLCFLHGLFCAGYTFLLYLKINGL